MRDDGGPGVSGQRGARMNGDGSGAPPWGPADPVPGVEDTQAIPGLGLGPAPEPRPAPEPGNPGGLGGPGDDEDAEGGTSGATAKRRRSFWREVPVLIAVALVLAFLIKTFVIQAFYIPSASMENTLEINDRVLINKAVYHLRPIHRGDIIVFDGTGSWDIGTSQPSGNIFTKAVDEVEGLVGLGQDSAIYIKRVVGLPGDRVACCDTKGQVTVNGVPLSEGSYLYPGNTPSIQKFSITVPAGRLWVMGDHRLVSYDSRGHLGYPGGGTIPESGVLGRAFVIIWPPSRLGILNIPATFEQPQLNASSGNAAAGGSTAALESALDNGTPVRPAASSLPLALGFTGAIPLTWLHRRLRTRRQNRRSDPRTTRQEGP